jgi:hypothetical protein
MAEIDEYIEKYCVKHEISREEAEKHAIVKEIAKYYEDAKKGEISVTEIKSGCGSAGQGGE